MVENAVSGTASFSIFVLVPAGSLLRPESLDSASGWVTFAQAKVNNGSVRGMTGLVLAKHSGGAFPAELAGWATGTSMRGVAISGSSAARCPNCDVVFPRISNLRLSWLQCNPLQLLWSTRPGGFVRQKSPLHQSDKRDALRPVPCLRHHQHAGMIWSLTGVANAAANIDARGWHVLIST